MEPTTSNRTFAAGSRQAPDPYDQFLEREGFYRKHTARDSTCLFRVVSEQVFDVQLYHDKVRADCVQFMRKRRDLYEKKINGNYDEYLDEMSKFRSYGSFVELNALAHAYRRNVLLFEPYNCGTWFVNCDSYEDTLMVFFSPEKHFDSIFPTTFIEQAAYCQALVYEVLYVRVFKLPDVMYSVERMLHDPNGKAMKIIEGTDKNGDVIEEKIFTYEGREFILDTPETTECVLDNYRLCHFHNRENFAHIVDVYRTKRSDKIVKEIRNVNLNGSRGPISRELVLVNPMLCEKKISCVRQLLKEGITPFPYKVAKALDPNIYRNIEFDSWSDIRRELKCRSWYFSGNGLQVGVRCLVKLNNHDERLLHGYIQEMKPNNGPCVVYLEELAECRSVSYEQLRPMATDHSKPWSFTYKSRKNSEDKAVKRKFQSKFMDVPKTKQIDDDLKGYMTCCGTDKSCCYNMSHYNGMHDFHIPPIEMVVMPFTIDDNSSQKSPQNAKTELNKSDKTDTQTETDNTDCSSSGFYDTFSTSSVPGQNPLFCYSYSDTFPYDATATTFYSQPYPGQPCAYATTGSYSCPFYGSLGPVAAVATHTALPAVRYSEGVPNFNAPQSTVPNGSDLPLNDMITLRYFYNLGIEYFRQNQFRMLPPPIPLSLETAHALPGIGEYVSNEEQDDKCLENDFERKLNVSSSSNENRGNNQLPRQRGTNMGMTKNENHPSSQRKCTYTSKSLNKKVSEHRTSCGIGTTISEYTSPSCVSPVLSNKQSTQSAAVDNSNGHEPAQTFSYGPAHPAINPYPIGVQLYANMDPMMTPQGACYVPTYVVHPYGTVMTPSPTGGIVAPPPPEMVMHEHLPSSPVDVISEAHGLQYGTHFPPIIYGPPQHPQGYTIWGYPQPQSIFSSNTSNNEDRNNDSGNVTQ
ncbi:protein ovarian tumor locus isoform X2 [Aedes albopictus]|uniref:OTU domain-containing protein n=1 Tax=Aedes albopictus TaxID=7160 RepID=A0ABM1YGH8_AEDAL|nr:protein ovarian tumor locus isoform X2 [Aedes albopictus]